MAKDIYGNEILDETEVVEETGDGQSAVEAITAAANAPVETTKVSPLDRIKGTRDPQISVQGIESAGTYGPQAFSTYFPSMQNEIQHGTYSGSMVGNNPIYAPSQLYPFGLIDARKQALAAAADAKVAEQDKWAQKMAEKTQPKLSKRDAVNPALQKQYYQQIEAYRNDFKRNNPGVGDVNKALMRDAGFNKLLNTHSMAVQFEDHGIDAVSKLETESAKPGRVLFGNDQDAVDGFVNGVYMKDIMSFDEESQKRAIAGHSELNKAKTYKSPQLAIGDLSAKIKPDDIEYFAGITPEDGFQMITTTQNEDTPAGRIKIAGMQSYSDEGYDEAYERYQNRLKNGGSQVKNPPPSPEQYLAALSSQFGKKRKTTIQTVADKDGGDYNFKMDETSLSTAPVSISSQTNQSGGVGSYSLGQSYNVPSTMQKPFEMAIPADARDVSGNIISGKTTGNVTSTVSQVGNAIIVHKKGSKADGKAIDQNDPDVIKHYKDAGFTFTVNPQAVVTVEGYDENGKKAPGQNSTIAVDLNHIKNNVMKVNKDGSYKSGVNIPLLEKNAKDQESELNKKEQMTSKSKSGKDIFSDDGGNTWHYK